MFAVSRSYCYGQKNRIVDGGMRAPIVGDRKRGAVGARVDFLDVVGVGGQIRAKCLCYNKRKMFHVTLFELFRAAKCCCDFARSFTVTLEKSVGRFKSMVGDCARKAG